MVSYSPTMAAIRFGYGLSPHEKQGERLDDLLGQLADGSRSEPMFPRGGIDEARQRADDLAEGLKEIRGINNGGERDRERRKLLQQKANQAFQRDAVARVTQAVFSPYGFHERLSGFWFDHFSVNAYKALPMRLLTPLYESEAIRPHLAGSFRDLLQAAILHPAMLIYLDQDRSAGPDSAAAQHRRRGLNENLGRELLELHTMGAGSGYTQTDVRSAALVLTGMTVNDQYEMLFRPRLAEPGQIDVLGVSYGGRKRSVDDCLSMLDDLAARHETAEHICRKLVAHFIADEPPTDMIKAMVDTWRASDGNLAKVYEVMVSQPRAWSDPGRKMKLPFDYVVSGLRALGIDRKSWRDIMSPDGDSADMADNTTAPAMSKSVQNPGSASGTNTAADMFGDIAKPAPLAKGEAVPGATCNVRKPGLARSMTIAALKRMGQPVWQPPSPAGFEEGVTTWLSPSQISERILWARKAANSLGRNIEPKTLLQNALADMARDDTIKVVQQAPNRASGITLVLSSPEFNRR
ncbi:uncharacterized protein (DUF1800 family) [Rhizobium sp. BIGb0125]|uniref:DUF1800 domain-containing protein n=1 Tax=Rhizobium sp. BIGb0125 TaxID=2940618 RepID=UPI00216757E1|nr:DUF1800 domain-containing protein [Rhizobium sp. BIGb0125]MCS4241307.1 uncharacterized protein (DUF1800 family) [Rhizobium sp. BIGb0125]